MERKGHSAFPWISVQPLLQPLLNMHTTSYMSVITYLHTNNPWNIHESMKERSCDNGWANSYWKALWLFLFFFFGAIPRIFKRRHTSFFKLHFSCEHLWLKSLSTSKTTTLFLYKPIKHATYSLLPELAITRNRYSIPWISSPYAENNSRRPDCSTHPLIIWQGHFTLSFPWYQTQIMIKLLSTAGHTLRSNQMTMDGISVHWVCAECYL